MKTAANSIPNFPSTYAPLLADLKARVRAAQVKAAVAVNRELILLYWHIGREILRAQKAEGWGAKVVERLAKDFAAEFPEMGGFSSLNLKRMKAFYAASEPVEIVQQPVGQLPGSIVSQPGTQALETITTHDAHNACVLRVRLIRQFLRTMPGARLPPRV